MMNCILIIGGIILYLFIGGFSAGLISGDDCDGAGIIVSMLIWPVILLFVIIGGISVSLGEWTREQLKDFWENWRSKR
jgi:hypothetical protein